MAVGEWDRRELCPDGSCVGVIGSNGQCKVCGRAATNWGNERERGLKDTGAAADADDDDEDEDDELAADGDEGDGDEGDGDEGDDDEGDDGRVSADGEGDEDGDADEDDDDDDDDDEDGDEDDDGDDDDDDDDDDDEDEEEDSLDPSTPSRLGAAKDWHQRKLCPDGGCVGVIGADGKCKACGRTAA